MGRRYRTYICGDSDCPHDPEFEHRFYFGCVPRDFSDRTGRSRTHRQTRVEHVSFAFGYRYLWDGGCDARKLAEAGT